MRGIIPTKRLLWDFTECKVSSGRIVSMNRREVCRVDRRDFAKAAKSLMALVKGTCLAEAVVASVRVVKYVWKIDICCSKVEILSGIATCRYAMEEAILPISSKTMICS